MTQAIDKARDQRLIQPGVSWPQFKQIQASFEGLAGVRLFYYAGVLEILAVSPEHEMIKSLIGHLVETYLVEQSIEFAPTGSMNQERDGIASAQADESYGIGSPYPKQPPDLSIEVVLSSGGEEKLERYRAIGVAEVWFWQDGLLSLYRLRQDTTPQYERVARSELLPGLDIELLTRCCLMSSRVEAIREFRRAIAKHP